MSQVVDSEFSGLLIRLYAGIGEVRPWLGFLEALAKWMDSTFATLIINAPGTSYPATNLTPGGSEDFVDNYSRALFADDPFRDLPDGQVVSYAEAMAKLPVDANAAYRKIMAESGFEFVLGVDLYFGKGGCKQTDKGRFEARFRISRHSSLPDFSVSDRTRLQALVPHLRTAVGLFERLQFAGAQHGAFHATAQGLGLALVVLDRNHSIVSSNALADRILAEREGLARHGEELVFAEAAQQRLIGDLLAGVAPIAPPPRFRVERPDHGDLIVTARSLDLSAIHAGIGALALSFARHGTETSADPQTLRDLLGLTKAEARLAAFLAEGHSLVEAARQLGISHNTAKVHLSAVFSKTGVHRQAQLVSLLASLNT